MSKPTFTITLVAKPDASDRDGTRRLRLALKTLLRTFGLRCIYINAAEPPTSTPLQDQSVELESSTGLPIP